MAKNETTYKNVFESKAIPTNDARKTLTVQTVTGSNGTLTVNLVQTFESDKKADSKYIKAIAFNVSNENMKSLCESFIEAQKVKTATEKKDPSLSARPKETASAVKTVEGKDQIAILKAAGMTDAEIKKVLARNAKAKAKPEPEAVEEDIFQKSVDLAVREELARRDKLNRKGRK